MAVPADLIGRTFGRGTVVRKTNERRRTNVVWELECECGQVYRASTVDLNRGHTRSCGCLVREGRIRHGHARVGHATPEYRAFMNARTRCHNPNFHQWADYGGRGIEFRFDTYEEFLDELGPRPSPEHTLDRIENDGHYERGNVRWATRTEQRLNTRPRRRAAA